MTVGKRLCLFLLLAPSAGADEGMWTFDNPPREQLQRAYGFDPTKEWLDRVRLASVRFMDGGSGSFVSPDGLMITNHHVGIDCIQNLSEEGKDYVASGFLAPSRDKEPACPGYEVNVLVATEDVTARVLGAMRPGMSDKEAGEARRAERARIEKECADRTKQRCDVIELYQGGEYDLYTYKKYTDVRFVFAPEEQTASFGGDPDNFTYPRHDLDIAIFRAYENGRPARPSAFLAWAKEGVREGDLVFVSGNPGSTSRLETMTQLESDRDARLPEALAYIERRLAVFRAYAERGEENARRSRAQILILENSRKAYQGMLSAVRDPKATARRAEEEKELRRRVAADPVLAQATGDPWAAIAEARKKADARLPERRYVGFGGSELLGIAGRIVRYVVETRKPNEARLEEYRDSNLPSYQNELFSTAPIYKDLEQVLLASRLEAAGEALGRDHAFLKAALQGKSPAEAAREAVAGTKLDQAAARKALLEGGPDAVAASADPMIALARRIDPLARDVRRFDEEVDDAISRAGQRVAQARFKLYGKTVPPDATFTLRLAYGTVKSYPTEGTVVQPWTTFHGLFDRSAAFSGKPPWNLSPRLAERKSALDLTTPLDFICTADVVGGNSGSPVINRAGELVGVVFDGNIQSLAWDYFYTDEQGRTVAVDARAIMEALRKVYDAGSVADELSGATRDR